MLKFLRQAIASSCLNTARSFLFNRNIRWILIRLLAVITLGFSGLKMIAPKQAEAAKQQAESLSHLAATVKP
ncbi:hypothetical protein H6F86_22130 [Phormidium sp. FACHB-592]|uniref:Uncharacterized protein n=1 Tax=Stenomitos frigidus AS-A4 TaxID=2933935 RepID=A0ABV0KFE8_9CYAN|nr:hypothetical protein [Phormidium sp. FACHB-592]MBD2076534.1 hypothetical protein [Phormidium sp. FACHB-592]